MKLMMEFFDLVSRSKHFPDFCFFTSGYAEALIGIPISEVLHGTVKGKSGDTLYISGSQNEEQYECNLKVKQNADDKL
jgi:hypothetical protein